MEQQFQFQNTQQSVQSLHKRLGKGTKTNITIAFTKKQWQFIEWGDSDFQSYYITILKMSHSQQNLQGNGKVWLTHRKKKRLTEIIPKEPQHTKNKDFNSLKYAL